MKKNLLLAFAAVCALGASAQDFTANGFNFNILSEDDATVEITTGDYNGKTFVTSGSTSSVTYNDKTYTIVAFGDNAFENQTIKVGSGTAWIDASVSYIGENAFTGASIGSSNSVSPANCLGMRSTALTWHPKAFVGNQLSAFNFNGDAEHYLNLTEAQALGDAHRGVVISRDKKTLLIFPGDKRNGTNQSYNKITSYTIYSAIENISDYAFSGNINLKSVTLPASLLTIGEEAFSHSVLTSFTVPANVTTLGPGFIAGAKSITEIGVAEGNANFQAIDGCVYTKVAEAAPALKDADGMTLVAVPYGATILNVAEGTTAIGAKAALDGQLESISIPATVETIGAEAFKGNHGITTIYCDAINAPAGADFEEEVFAAELTLPEGANLDSYYNDPVWSQFELPERPIPTGVTDLNTTVTKAQNVYTVDGRLVRQNVTSLEGLDAGLYIFGGKKVAVK